MKGHKINEIKVNQRQINDAEIRRRSKLFTVGEVIMICTVIISIILLMLGRKG